MYFLLFAIILILIVPKKGTNKYNYQIINMFQVLKNKFKTIDKKNAYKILLELHDVFKNNNLFFFLSEGTALGFKRNNDFIDHDDDIDIGIFKKDKLRIDIILNQLIKDYGYKLINYNLNNNLPFIQIQKYSIIIDIELVDEKRNCITKFGPCKE